MGFWKEIFSLLDDLNKRLGMIVIIICHSTVTAINDPETESYDVATLKLHKLASALFAEWADVIGYAKRPIIVRQNDSGDHKAIDTGVNVMNELIIGKTATCISGNRYSLPTKIPLTWAAFDEALRATFPVTQSATAVASTTTQAGK